MMLVFFGYSNVIDNYAGKAYIRKQSDQTSVMNCRECYFTSTNNFNTSIDTGSIIYDISIEDCYFDEQYSDLKDYSTKNLVFTSKRSNTLAQNTVQNICDGVNITNGAVCGDDKCLVENLGCDEDKFNF